MATINSFLEFMQVFPNEDSCIQYLEKKRGKTKSYPLSTLLLRFINVRAINIAVKTQGSILL